MFYLATLLENLIYQNNLLFFSKENLMKNNKKPALKKETGHKYKNFQHSI